MFTYIRHKMRHLTCAHARPDAARSICLPQEGPEAGVKIGNEVFRDCLQLDVQVFLGGVLHIDTLDATTKSLERCNFLYGSGPAGEAGLEGTGSLRDFPQCEMVYARIAWCFDQCEGL